MQDLSRWTPRPRPTNEPMRGSHVMILPFERARHETALWEAFGSAQTNALLHHFGWPHMESATELGGILQDRNENGGFITCVFAHPDSGEIMGMASYMRIDERNGVAEVGAVAHGAAMARSSAATEAQFLLARRIFDLLGYRRYEWKLNNANKASHRAARRLGFTFEGVFRQHQVKPYGNRDTAWYSIIDKEWPVVRSAFEQWLDPSNFERGGGQKRSLDSIRKDILEKGS